LALSWNSQLIFFVVWETGECFMTVVVIWELTSPVLSSFFRILRYPFAVNLLRSLVWCRRLQCTPSITCRHTAVFTSRSSRTIQDSPRGLTAEDTMSVTVWLITAKCDNSEDKYRFHKLELLHSRTLTVLSMQNFISFCSRWAGVVQQCGGGATDLNCTLSGTLRQGSHMEKRSSLIWCQPAGKARTEARGRFMVGLPASWLPKDCSQMRSQRLSLFTFTFRAELVPSCSDGQIPNRFSLSNPKSSSK